MSSPEATVPAGVPDAVSRSDPGVGIERAVPRISYFYGITITMHWDEPHHSRPHFHARYGDYKASLDLTGQIIVGSLPKRILRRVRDWAELHADELDADWQRVVNEEPPVAIAPLP